MRLTTLVFLIMIPVFAQQPPDGPRPQGQKHGPPTNLKLLDPAKLMPTMMAFTAALGVQCDHCHVPPNFASDEKPTKTTARQMIVMARHINEQFPDGKMHVSCYTCHRGALQPATAPPPRAGGGAGAPADNGPATHPPATPPGTPPAAPPAN